MRPACGPVLWPGVLQDPNINLRAMDIDSAVVLADQKFGFINHTSTDLDAFIGRGGKLIMYHGWDDPSISPMNSINYYTSVVERMRDKRHLNGIEAAMAETQKSARLFLIPGMGHCGGGPGPDTFDAIGTLDQWVDHGMAPDKIIASHITPDYKRPLCAYPQQPRYNGSGDRTDAATWKCVSEPKP